MTFIYCATCKEMHENVKSVHCAHCGQSVVWTKYADHVEKRHGNWKGNIYSNNWEPERDSLKVFAEWQQADATVEEMFGQ